MERQMVHIHNVCNGIGLVSWALLFSSTNKGPSSFKLCFILGWCVNYSVITFSHILLYDSFFRNKHSDPCSMLHNNNPSQSGISVLHCINNPPSAPACQMSLHFKWVLQYRRHCICNLYAQICFSLFCTNFFSFVQFIS